MLTGNVASNLFLGILQKRISNSTRLPQITNFTSGQICSPQKSFSRIVSFYIEISAQIFFFLAYFISRFLQILSADRLFYFVN